MALVPNSPPACLQNPLDDDEFGPRDAQLDLVSGQSICVAPA
jgi:hypothetical protein